MNKMLAVAALATVLMGCQGQNPFKRESNPIKDYPRTQEVANKAYVPGQTPAPVVKTNNDQPTCFEAFKISTEPEYGNLLMKFVEGVESTYTIKVRSMHTANFTVTHEIPDGASFLPVSKNNNTATYKFTWKPGSGTADLVPAGKFVLTYNAKFTKDACASSNTSTPLNIVVSKTREVPTISFPDIKRNITFGEKIDFAVIIDDPAAVAGKAPTLHDFTFLASARNSERTILDATGEGLSCDDTGVPLDANRFQFNCHFDSNLLKGLDKRQLGSGKEFGAVFYASAQSTRSGFTSAPTPQRINVMFEKIDTNTTAEVKQEKTEQKKTTTKPTVKTKPTANKKTVAGDKT